MLCLPITKAVLISTAVVCFLVTTGTDVYTLTVSYTDAKCTFGVWTTTCSERGMKISLASSNDRFDYYTAAIATEAVQVFALIFGGIAALWSIVAVVVLVQSKSKKPMSWKCCGVVLHVLATIFGVLLPIAMGVWSALNDRVTGTSGLVDKSFSAGFFFAIFGCILLLVSSFLACAECCGGEEGPNSAQPQPLQQVLYHPAPSNAVVDAIGSGAKTEHPYASIQQAE